MCFRDQYLYAFIAIADSTRCGITDLVAKESIHIHAIAENFGMSRPAVSKHIKVLLEAGLVGIGKQGRDRYLYL
ncbi:winged helix-turn-helix transcriptional regulator [Flavobacteriaceae bacterium TP-CH-4]|uniref:Winged helix-turn-helix transcriptional regulator n=1 Tax=Pelagihabitans pacificus TaxID=2696054 RepID=A0A967AV09_9FLAO|nr:winged helix-turn-helix domain-containing protein [Pelagihabitans pacificus]NHF60457.1 winged helix-turn-helix transcriptional regulator [Pelagihabitans pacificus]